MNREIKFRGKNNIGKWIYGYYFRYEDKHLIVPGEYSSKPSETFEVDSKTIGQFTGRLAADKKEIYEGDKVADTIGGVLYEIVFDNEDCSFVLSSNNGMNTCSMMEYSNESLILI